MQLQVQKHEVISPGPMSEIRSDLITRGRTRVRTRVRASKLEP